MTSQNLRQKLYYRLRWLWPVLGRSAVRHALSWLGWLLFAGWLVFAALILALRYVILPGVSQYQPQIERMASEATGLQVRIGKIDARWQGLNPGLSLGDVALFDKQGRQAFALSHVDSVLSWQSLWRLRPTLALLAVDGPVLHVRRDTAGRVTIAGVDAEGESDPRIAEWVLEQPHIRIRNAIIVWEDALRKAPPLILEDLQFGLDNRGSRHRFGLSAAPPSNLAARIDVRGDVRGSLGEAFDQLSGKVFVELDYADLAGWRSWLDYPIELPSGRGALRVWANWDEGHAQLTTDVALEDLRLRLGKNLPQLELANMRGRLEARYGEEAWRVAAHQVELQTLNGIRVAPTDFAAEWRKDARQGLTGNASANFVDLDALKRLAAFLPLDPRSRELLTTHDPRGRVADLRASWEASQETLRRYTLKAQFEDLGVKAAGYFPGAEGLSGQLDVSEKGGSLLLDSKQSALDLPAVFPQSQIPLSSLRAKANWIINGSVADVKLERLEFSGPHATGSARGSYRFTGDGPGIIDLAASITQADGTAVWRYMPHAVNATARNWLQRSITGGRGSDAKLTLKGDLRDFPFRDKSKGQFIITAKAQGAKLDYAPGWPSVNDIDGIMVFGVGMHIEASKGSILGTRVGPVVVDIPDFESEEEMLFIKGQVEGPTAEFLRFIDTSPVGDKIDRFTEEMRAEGNGQLALELDMPLRQLTSTRVRGDYRFQNNQVTAIPGLPAVTQVNGRLLITENSITAQDIAGQVLGGPMKLSVKNEGDRVAVTMHGTANLREAKKQFDWPVLEQLSGTTPWKGEVKVRKKNADFIVESPLTGLSSSLPDPFNKTAGSSLPIRVEKSTSAEPGKGQAARDQIRVTLGKVAEARILRRHAGENMEIERGAIAIGEALANLPDSGLAVAVNMPRIDLDTWRNLLPPQASGGPSILSRLTVKTPLMHAFARDYNNVEISARPRGEGWQVGLSTREMAGDLFWKSAGEGWLEANLKRLAIPSGQTSAGAGDDLLKSLPGMDIRVDDFALGDKHLGKLELKARNDHGTWRLDNLHVQNPDGALDGKGQWDHSGGHHTRLAFELNAGDLGKLLDRLGYPGTVRGGSGGLKGELVWDGPLTTINYPSLSGNLTVTAAKGQFNKLEPGFGKLLGLMSLQSLPRRLTLDFRDIFSDGLAFDSIDGKLAVKSGIMRTNEELRIDGPSTRIIMKGETDLKQETQNIVVTVQPEMGMVVSAGALLLAHPVIGAAAAVANKLLQNPLNKVFSFQYRITGNWADPKVDKVGQSLPAETAAPPLSTSKTEAPTP